MKNTVYTFKWKNYNEHLQCEHRELPSCLCRDEQRKKNEYYERADYISRRFESPNDPLHQLGSILDVTFQPLTTAIGDMWCLKKQYVQPA